MKALTVMRTMLLAVCAFTMLATVYLTLSLIILRPPRANYQEWTLMAALFVAQGLLTVIAAAGFVSPLRIRWALVAGGAAIIVLGARWAYATVSGAHFEGYALVLGSILVVQGALTLLMFWRPGTIDVPEIATKM